MLVKVISKRCMPASTQWREAISNLSDLSACCGRTLFVLDLTASCKMVVKIKQNNRRVTQSMLEGCLDSVDRKG